MKEYFESLAENSYRVRFLVWLLVLNFVDLLVLLVPVRVKRSVPRKVVFTRLDSIGDYLIWTSTFSQITKLFPAPIFELVFVGNKNCREFADLAPIFHERLYVDRKRLVTDPVYRFRIMRRVRRLNAHIIINPTLSRDFLWSDSIVRCSGARERIGSRGLANRMTRLAQMICDGWYSQLINSPETVQHEGVSNRDFLNALSSNDQQSKSIPLPSIPVPAGSNNFHSEQPFAVFFLGAQFGYKRWPVDRFAEVALWVTKNYGLQIVICGGPGEEAIADEFTGSFAGNCVNLVGKTSLSELSNVIANADLVVSNDTSVCHVAVAHKRPVVVVNSGAHIGRFFPYPAEMMAERVVQASVATEMPCFGCDWNCIYTELTRDQPKPCITNVSVDQVVSAVDSVLSYEPFGKSNLATDLIVTDR